MLKKKEEKDRDLSSAAVAGDETMQTMAHVGAYGVARRKSRFTLKRILIAIGCVILAAAVGLVVYQIVKEKYTDAIDEQVDLLNDRTTDLEQCLDVSGGKMKKEFVMEYGQVLTDVFGNDNTWESGMEDVFTNQYDRLEESFGSGFEVSYEIVSEKQLDETELKNYSEDIRDYLSNGIGEAQEAAENEKIKEWQAEQLTEFFEKWYKKYSDVKMTDGYSVIANITYSSNGQEKVVPMRMIVVQINGDWVVRVGGLIPLDSARIFENMTY